MLVSTRCLRNVGGSRWTGSGRSIGTRSCDNITSESSSSTSTSTTSRTSNGNSSSLQHFLGNRRIDLLTRFQGLAKRLRIRAKLYNDYRYRLKLLSSHEGELPSSFVKLNEDSVDYDKVTRELVVELLTKITFLSNGDCIQVADILSRIKKPLHRIRSEGGSRFVNDGGSKVGIEDEDGGGGSGVKVGDAVVPQKGRVTEPSVSSGDQNNVVVVPFSHESIAQDSTIRLIVKAQRVLFGHLLEAYKEKVLTKSQRYYLFCMLSKECSLASLETWTLLTGDLKNDVASNSSYLPFEHANLLLIYDQVCRWLSKRLARAAESKGSYEIVEEDEEGRQHHHYQCRQHHHLVSLNREVTLSSQQRSTYDPFDSEFLDNILSKLMVELHQLKSEKILKLLYLQRSRGIFKREFFEIAFRELASRFGIHQDGLKIYRTAIGIYHRATMSCLWKELELISGKSQFRLMDSVEGSTGSINRVVIPSQGGGGDDVVETQTSNVVDILQLRAASDLVRSLSLSLIGLIVLYIRIVHHLCGMAMPNFRDLIDVLMEHSNCGGDDGGDGGDNNDDDIISTVLQCASSQVITDHTYATSKDDVVTSQLVGLLKMVLSHVHFDVALLNLHLPESEEWHFIQRRSMSHMCCYCQLAVFLVDILCWNAKNTVGTLGRDELQDLVSLVKKAASEAEQCREGQDRTPEVLKAICLKLEEM